MSLTKLHVLIMVVVIAVGVAALWVGSVIGSGKDYDAAVHSRSADARTMVSDLQALRNELEPLAIGDNPNTSGNSFSHGVSAEFGEPELRRLYLELNGPAARAKMQRYVCPERLPAFTVTVVLYYEGPYQERLVRLQMTPPLYKDSGAVEDGIGYLFESAIKRIDKGPPIDYGYRNPHDGSHITTKPFFLYHEPTEHDCGTLGPPAP